MDSSLYLYNDYYDFIPVLFKFHFQIKPVVVTAKHYSVICQTDNFCVVFFWRGMYWIDHVLYLLFQYFPVYLEICGVQQCQILSWDLRRHELMVWIYIWTILRFWQQFVILTERVQIFLFNLVHNFSQTRFWIYIYIVVV